MRPRTLPKATTFSLKVSVPSEGEDKVEVPPIEIPARLGKLGKDISVSAPTTKRFGSM
jgi:hypothetical protein